MDEWEGRLRVAMFSNVYYPTSNGVVVSVDAFRKALTRLGHHTYIFAPACGDIEDRAPNIFRYPAVELPLQKYPLTLPVSPYVDRLLRNLQPQILHANHPALLGHVAQRKSQELNLPLVFTYHTRYADYSHYLRPLPEEKVKEFIESWIGEFLCHCHHLIVPSQSIQVILEERFGITDNISVVPTGIDLEEFPARSKSEARQALGWSCEEKVLISMGRLGKEKGFDLLIRAFSLLPQKNLRLVIVGAGDELAELQDLAGERNITFAGFVDHAIIPTYLAAADLFVFASVTETQGLVTLEALASGLPVVAVDASGTRDAVSPDCSRLTAAEPEALAQGIAETLARSDLPALGEAARRRASQFGLLEQGQKMVDAYQRAREAHRQGVRVLAPQAEEQSRWQGFLKFFGF